MSNSYTLPYEPINSRAKLIRLPTKEQQRSRSVGRSFWTRLWTGSHLSPCESHSHLRSESPSSTARSQTSTVLIQDINQRHSRSSTKSSHSNINHPKHSPRTSVSRNSLAESNGRMPLTEPCPEDRKWRLQFPQTKTTVTVHLSKTKSTPNLTENSQFIEDRRVSRSSAKHSNESSNFNGPRTEKNKSLSVDTFINTGETKDISKPRSRSLRKEKSSLELNSLQVFRQQKYRERIKSEQKIQQLEHLKHNYMCKKLVDQLGKGMQPQSYYKNQNPLNLVNFIHKDGFVTSSRKRLPPKPTTQICPEITEENFCSDHIYTEINEENLKSFPDEIIKTPVFRKKVTFSSFHEPVVESGPLFQEKKILPAFFRGIVQVTQPLRSRTDDERRRAAYLCYHAIATSAKDSSHKFLGKVDNSRWGECIYMVLDETHFEIRDGDGLIIVKHGFSDVSVITQIKGDPCLFVYVGRCKFNGRVGVTIRFNKSKHLPLVLSYFTKRQ